MSARVTRIVAFLVVWALFACTRRTETATTMPASQFETTVSSMLKGSQRPAALVYRGKCGTGNGMRDLQTSFRLTTPPEQIGSPVDTLRRMLSSEPKLNLAEDKGGYIRVSSVDVNRDFLDVKISVSLPKNYNVYNALERIMDSPEVRKFVGEHQMRLVPSVFVVPVTLREKNSTRHDAIKLVDKTVSDALDHLVGMTAGLWIYKECIDPQGTRLANIQVQLAPMSSDLLY